MNLYNKWVSLSEMSDKKYWPFHDIQLFFRCTCISDIESLLTTDKSLAFDLREETRNDGKKMDANIQKI